MTSRHSFRIACLATLQPLPASPGAKVWLQLTPDGTFRAIDGRPADVAAWRMDAAIAAQVIRRFSERRNPLLIDYEHQTLTASQNGQPAPAAGWISALRHEPGKGLLAQAELTGRARAAIRADEYRYLSPVFAYDETGAITDIRMAALTNNPGLDGMDAVALSRFFNTNPEEEPGMDLLKELQTRLGLDASADEAAILAALDALIGKSRAEKEPSAAPASGNAALSRESVEEAIGKMAADLAALAARAAATDVEALIVPALADGRISGEAEARVLRELGQKDLAALTSCLAVRQPIAALTRTQTGGKAPAGASSPETSPLISDAMKRAAARQ